MPTELLSELDHDTIDRFIRKEAAERNRRQRYQRQPHRIEKHREYQQKYQLQRRMSKAAFNNDIKTLQSLGLNQNQINRLLEAAGHLQSPQARAA